MSKKKLLFVLTPSVLPPPQVCNGGPCGLGVRGQRSVLCTSCTQRSCVVEGSTSPAVVNHTSLIFRAWSIKDIAFHAYLSLRVRERGEVRFFTLNDYLKKKI